MKITYSKDAIKYLKKQDKPTKKRIMTALEKIPKIGDVKELQNRNGYR